MRIGLFTDSYKPYICGVTTSVDMLRQGLESLGHEVYVICTKMTPEQAKTYHENDSHVIRMNGVHLHKKGMNEFRLSFFSNIKYRRLRKFHFDIVHIHTEFSMGYLGLVYAKKMKVPVIYTSHTMWEDYFHFVSAFLAKHAHPQLMWGLKKLMNTFAKNASYTIVPSEKFKETLDNYALQTQYRVIPTGIDIDRFFSKNVDLKLSKEIRLEHKIKDEDFCFLYLGRASLEKSVDILLDAFIKLNNPYTKFLIVGDGTAIQKLKKTASEYQYSENIIFIGSVPWEKVPAYYHAADCFINASNTETQGLTYIEGLASSLPVIYRRDKVLDNVVIENENGLLFDTVEELVQKMQLIMTDNDLRKKLITNASKSVEKYSKECYTNNVLNLYREVLKQKDEA